MFLVVRSLNITPLGDLWCLKIRHGKFKDFFVHFLDMKYKIWDVLHVRDVLYIRRCFVTFYCSEGILIIVESRIQTHRIERKVKSGSASNWKAESGSASKWKAESGSASKWKVGSGFSIKVQQICNTNGSYSFIVHVLKTPSSPNSGQQAGKYDRGCLDPGHCI